jgi:hypothetical protein
VHLTPARSDSASGGLPPAVFFFGLVALGSLATPLRADGAKDQNPVVMDSVVVDATKTHVLFMGADIAVNLDRDSYPVRNVVGSSWVISINGDEKSISTKRGEANLNITPGLKLTATSATISGFRKSATYSYGNDPNVLLTRALTRSGEVTADLDSIASDANHALDIQQSVNKAGGSPYGGMVAMARSNNQFGDSTVMQAGRYASTLSLAVQSAGAASNLAAGDSEATGKIATSGLDALQIDFTISASRPLSAPYVVTMTRFRLPGTKPGFVKVLVYARALDPLDARPSEVHFAEDGFPFNYELVDFQLHLYDHGVEVATNLASNRVELTRDEAFEYVKMEYLGSHARDTLPATPAMGQLPAGFPGKVASGRYSVPVYVQVTKEGRSGQVFADPGCTRPIDDPFLVAVAEGIRFKPALEAGRPVAGVAELNLNKLVL